MVPFPVRSLFVDKAEKHRKSIKKSMKSAEISKNYIICSSNYRRSAEENPERPTRIRRLRANHDIIGKYRYLYLETIISYLWTIICEWDPKSQSIFVSETKHSPKQMNSKHRPRHELQLHDDDGIRSRTCMISPQKLKSLQRNVYSLPELKVRLYMTPFGVAILREIEILHLQKSTKTSNTRLSSYMKHKNEKSIVQETCDNIVSYSNLHNQEISHAHDHELSPNDSSGLSNLTEDHNDTNSSIILSPEELFPPIFTTDVYGCSSTSSSTVEDASIPSKYQAVTQDSTTREGYYYQRGSRRRRTSYDGTLIFPMASPPIEDITLPSRRNQQVEPCMPLIPAKTSAFSKIRSSSCTYQKSILVPKLDHGSKDSNDISLSLNDADNEATLITKYNPFGLLLEPTEKTNTLEHAFESMTLTLKSLDACDRKLSPSTASNTLP
jgi:hypothetical protein